MSEANWNNLELRNLAEVNPETLGGGTSPNVRFRYFDITSVSPGRVNWPVIKEFEFRDAPSRARRIVRSGDTLFCTVRPTLQAHVNVDWSCGGLDVCSTGFAVFRPRGCDPRFLFHKVFSDEVTRYVRQREVGSNYPAVNESDLRVMPLLVPESPDEQTQIGRVLDTVDSAVRAAEAIIAKLNQIKIGVVQDLLNLGLDEHGAIRDPVQSPKQFQDSRIGSFPITWTVEPLSKLLIGIDAGKSPNCPNYPAPKGEWGILKVSAVTNDGFISTENKHLENGRYVNQTLVVRQGDLLITRCNTPDLVGTACLVDKAPPPLLLCDKTLRLRLNSERDDSHYLVHALRMPQLRRQIEISATGSSGSMKNISQHDIRRYLVPRPPFEEQQRIACKIGVFERRIAAEEHRLRKLQVLKSGLAHDLLTGEVRIPITASISA
jgi:type I restriction enzyme S subunit